MEVFIKGYIISENEKNILDGKGNFEDETLSWIDNISVKYSLDFTKKIFTKEDKTIRLELVFQKGKETKGTIVLKENNIILEVAIFTKCFDIEENNCKIMYQIIGNLEQDNLFSLYLTWK